MSTDYRIGIKYQPASTFVQSIQILSHYNRSTVDP